MEVDGNDENNAGHHTRGDDGEYENNAENHNRGEDDDLIKINVYKKQRGAAPKFVDFYMHSAETDILRMIESIKKNFDHNLNNYIFEVDDANVIIVDENNDIRVKFDVEEPTDRKYRFEIGKRPLDITFENGAYLINEYNQF